jgi:hypothetical protein
MLWGNEIPRPRTQILEPRPSTVTRKRGQNPVTRVLHPAWRNSRLLPALLAVDVPPGWLKRSERTTNGRSRTVDLGFGPVATGGRIAERRRPCMTEEGRGSRAAGAKASNSEGDSRQKEMA